MKSTPLAKAALISLLVFALFAGLYFAKNKLIEKVKGWFL